VIHFISKKYLDYRFGYISVYFVLSSENIHSS